MIVLFVKLKNINIKKNQTAPIIAANRKLTRVNEAIHSDYKGPINPASHKMHYILVIVDSFSKFAKIKATKTCSAFTNL